MRQPEKVIIAGAGPAGGYCALTLAEKGIYPIILDHSHPREKPCGGGITPTTAEKFPFVNAYRTEGNTNRECVILTCTNRKITQTRQGFNISRRFFDKEILNKAIDKGAKLIEEKVIAVKHDKNIWHVQTNKQSFTTKILVGADGVNSVVRKATVGSFTKDNLALGFGYLATGAESQLTTIKYFDPLTEIQGMAWMFPRKYDTTIGIGILGATQKGRLLKPLLDDFIKTHWEKVRITARFAHMIPLAKSPAFFSLPCSGKNWLLVGDAAGHVDPISGEGILYALWSGKLAAEAIKGENLSLYDQFWRKEYGNYLKKRSKERDIFYNPVRMELAALMVAKHHSKIRI